MIQWDDNEAYRSWGWASAMGVPSNLWYKLLLTYPNRLTIINKYFGGCKIQLDSTCQVFFLHRKQDFSHFLCFPCIINSCMEEVYVGVIYNTLLDSNEGDLIPHASQTIYFSNKNENMISDRGTPMELSSLEPRYGIDTFIDNFY